MLPVNPKYVDGLLGTFLGGGHVVRRWLPPVTEPCDSAADIIVRYTTRVNDGKHLINVTDPLSASHHSAEKLTNTY